MNSKRLFAIILSLVFVTAGAMAQQDQAQLNSKTVVPSWAKKTSTGEAVFENPMEMPRFPGCEHLAQEERYPCSINRLAEFIGKEVKYPAAAKEQKVEGTVLVEFVVDRNGSVIDAKVKKSVSASLDAEALRVVRKMPKWIPGKEEGTIVNSLMTFPIKFQLSTANQ